ETLFKVSKEYKQEYKERWSGYSFDRPMQTVDWDVMANNSSIFRDFIDGNECFYDPALFGILTNLLCCKGCKEVAEEAMKLANHKGVSEYTPDKFAKIEKMESYGYAPMRLSDIEDRAHLDKYNDGAGFKNLIVAGKPKTYAKTNRVTLAEVDKKLKLYMDRAFEIKG